ncbi:glycosyltransferase [Altererythrobacter sp. GH1-8]|uniref:glycosyltransferase n=1 Tax=Altererythrobacter sp. GH1-8 TaxID=3349333 RepID=UPI00374DB699
MRGTYRLKLLLRELRQRWLLYKAERAVARFPKVTARAAHGLPNPLIVTLTSFPPRFPMLAKTLKSLLDQNVRADRVVLWLAESDIDQLPPEVLALRDHGLDVRDCKDTRSYKKLIPALERWPEATFVTADDDVYYPPDWLAWLVEAARAHPRDVIGTRAHMAQVDKAGRLSSYADWELATSAQLPRKQDDRLFPTGVGGILYPPGSLHPDVSNEAQFRSLCPNGDDIWFFWMARKAGTRHRRTQAWFDIVEWPTDNRISLSDDNYLGDGNDRQIKATEQALGVLP